MKLTKEKLQQIIKEELENLAEEENDLAKKHPEAYKLVLNTMRQATSPGAFERGKEYFRSFLGGDILERPTKWNNKYTDGKIVPYEDIEPLLTAATKQAEDELKAQEKPTPKSTVSDKYAKKPDPSTLKFGKTLTPPDYGKLGT